MNHPGTTTPVLRRGVRRPRLALALLLPALTLTAEPSRAALTETQRFTVVQGKVPVSGGEEFCFSLAEAAASTERVRFQIRFATRVPQGALVIDEVRGLPFRDLSEEIAFTLEASGSHRMRLALDEPGTLETLSLQATTARIVKMSCAAYEEEQVRRLDLRAPPPPRVDQFERGRTPAPPPPLPAPPTGPSRPQDQTPPGVQRSTVLSAGTEMSVVLRDSLSTKTAYVGQTFSAHLADAVLRDGRPVLPSGTRIVGHVIETNDAGRFGRSSLRLAFDKAVLDDGREIALQGTVQRLGKGSAKKQGGIIAGSAAGGALLGQVLGGDRQATLLGALAGAAIASGSIAAKPGESIELQAGSALTISLDNELEVPGL